MSVVKRMALQRDYRPLRTDEANFRANVPSYVGLLSVLEVIGYRPGQRDTSYAYAYALCTDNDGASFSTYRIICRDDPGLVAFGWLMECGQYGFESREDAWRDLVERAGRKLVCACCVGNECECTGNG